MLAGKPKSSIAPSCRWSLRIFDLRPPASPRAAVRAALRTRCEATLRNAWNIGDRCWPVRAAGIRDRARVGKNLPKITVADARKIDGFEFECGVYANKVVFAYEWHYGFPLKKRGDSTMKRAVMYLRVSTLDQTTANQERELQAVADRAGWEVVRVYKDHGISGAKGRDKRPQFDALCK